MIPEILVNTTANRMISAVENITGSIIEAVPYAPGVLCAARKSGDTCHRTVPESRPHKFVAC
jgi:hypothetical protein